MNIEDQFWLDVMSVVEAVHDQDKAIGNSMRFLRFAQEKHKQGKLISEDDFRARGFLEALVGIFAERVSGGIQAAGASKYFGWLDQKAEAGSKGGRSKSEAKTKHLKQNRSKTEAKRSKASDTEASYSSSYSPSSSDSRTSSESLLKREDENPSDSKPQAFVAAYCERFKARWGVNPPIQGKESGILGRLAREMSLARFEFLLDAYFQMPDAWVVKDKHPIGMFNLKINQIVVYADAGKFTTSREAQQADNTVTNALLLQKVQRGEA